jgi:hypothetical protein
MIAMNTLWALLVGCLAPDVVDTGAMGVDNSPVGDAGGACDVVGEQSLGFNETAVGTNATDVLGVVQGTHNKTLTWSTAATTGITLTLSAPSNARLVDLEVVSEDGGATIEIACLDYLAIDMNLRVATVDGQLNFDTPATVRAYDATVKGFSVSLDRNDILFNASAWVSEPYDTLTSELGVEWSGSAMIGQITGIAEQHSGSGDGGTVSASYVIIAQF